MALRTIDITFRRRDYRLAEPARSAGASVRPCEQLTACASCGRVIPVGARYVRESNRTRGYHVLCSIRVGVLEPMAAGQAGGGGGR